jgi:hypothetical protein
VPVYVPRELRLAFREHFAAILAEAFAGELSTYYTNLDDRRWRVHHPGPPAARYRRSTMRRSKVVGEVAQLVDRLEEAATAELGDERRMPGCAE